MNPPSDEADKEPTEAEIQAEAATTEKPPVGRHRQLSQTIRYKFNLSELAQVIHKNACEHGFHPPEQNIGDWLAHMCCNKHAEVTELYDAWRSGKLHEDCDKAPKMRALGMKGLTCAEEELADIIIRAIDEAARLGIDIAQAVAVKHVFNTTRPFKHGKAS